MRSRASLKLAPPGIPNRALMSLLPALLLALCLTLSLPSLGNAQSYYYGNKITGGNVLSYNTTCDSTMTGAIRWNSGTSSFEGCNGSSWGSIGGSMAIGSAVTSGTQGSVLFVSGGDLAQDHWNLFWDETNHYLGIGNSSPNALLDIGVGGSQGKAGTMRLEGATSGYVGFTVPAAAGSATYTWPSAAPIATMVLQSDPSGNLSWVVNGAGVKWNMLSGPDLTGANLALSMGHITSTFTYDSATGANNLFSLLDTNNNTGTGALLFVSTGTNSAAAPLHLSAQGAADLIFTSAGLLQAGVPGPDSLEELYGVTPQRLTVNYTETTPAANDEKDMEEFNYTFDPSADSTGWPYRHGFSLNTYIPATNATNQTQTWLEGVQEAVRNHGTGDWDTLIGANMWAETDGGSNVTWLTGMYGGAGAYGTGTTQYLDGGYAWTDVEATASVDNMYGLEVQFDNHGTVTNRYGIYLRSPSGSALADDYGIYEQGSQINYFAGAVGIGTTNPSDTNGSNALKVVGANDTDVLNVSNGTNEAGFYFYNGESVPMSIGTVSNINLGFFTNNGQVQFDLNTNGGAGVGTYADNSTYAAPPANGLIVSGNVGIGTSSPAAMLHVAGEAIIGNTGLACSSTTEGALRWDSTNKLVNVCDGTNWAPLVAVGLASSDPLPDAFSFTDLTDQAISSLIYSETLNITGFDGPVTAQVSGSGSPQLQVNGGAWVTAAVINPGDSLRVRVVSSSSANTAVITTVTVGTGTDNWSVTTRAGQLRMFKTSGSWQGGAVGGLDGADAKCQTEAGTLGYSGTWRAILSDAYTNVVDRLVLQYPIVRASDSVVVESSDLWAASLENSPFLSGSSTPYWSGSSASGIKEPSTCNSWTSSSSSTAGYTGDAIRTDFNWISSYALACNNAYPLLCIEQDATHFDDKTNVPLSTSIQSNATYVTGTGGAVSISGSGSPEFSINGGAWTTSGSASAGDTVRLQLTSSSSINTQLTATVTIGSNNYDWHVTTQDFLLRIFSTSGTYDGNLGGLSGADSICQSEATTKGYGGTWKAILSDSTTNAKDRLTLQYPIALASNTTTIVESTDLWASSLESAVGGVAVSAWTGSTPTGALGTNFCSDWTSNSSGINGDIGQSSGTDGSWIQGCCGHISSCSTPQILYCIEQ
jgi:Protein of unknown function (DUF1554)